MGYEKPNWEYVEKSDLSIPVNFKSTLSQESIKKEGLEGRAERQ